MRTGAGAIAHGAPPDCALTAAYEANSSSIVTFATWSLGAPLRWTAATTLASSVDVYPYTVNGSHSVNTNSYYLTLEELITGSEASVDSHFTTTVPEPSTLLLGLTGLGLGLAKYRRRVCAG